MAPLLASKKKKMNIKCRTRLMITNYDTRLSSCHGKTLLECLQDTFHLHVVKPESVYKNSGWMYTSPWPRRA